MLAYVNQKLVLIFTHLGGISIITKKIKHIVEDDYQDKNDLFKYPII